MEQIILRWRGFKFVQAMRINKLQEEIHVIGKE
jgi:hypothetical protein